MTKTCCPPDCPRRSITCRGNCEAWAAHEAEKALVYARRRERAQFANFHLDAIRKAIRRWPRK